MGFAALVTPPRFRFGDFPTMLAFRFLPPHRGFSFDWSHDDGDANSQSLPDYVRHCTAIELAGEVKLFGSFFNGFNTGATDVDLAFIPNAGQESAYSFWSSLLTCFLSMASVTSSILSASVPLVKFTDISSGFEVDSASATNLVCAIQSCFTHIRSMIPGPFNWVG